MIKRLSPTKNIAKQRNEGLDLLRALAIICVLISHGSEIIKNYIPESLFEFFYWTGGFVGVELFFVLSGYLVGTIFITNIVLKKEVSISDIQKFWISRWFRTLPSYYLILIFSIGLYYITGGEIPYAQLPLYFIFSQNLFTPHPNFFNIAWSLSVEEWFYISLPITYFIGYKFLKTISPKSILLYILLSVIIISPILRFLFINHTQELQNWDVTIRKVIILRADAIMWGVLLAWLSIYRSQTMDLIKKTVTVGIVFIISAIVLLNQEEGSALQQNCIYPLMNIGTFLIIPYCLSFSFKYDIVKRLFTNISMISYSIYLLHSFVCVIFIRYITASSLPQGIIYLGLFGTITYVVSTIFYNYFEEPVTSLRDKFK